MPAKEAFNRMVAMARSSRRRSSCPTACFGNSEALKRSAT